MKCQLLFVWRLIAVHRIQKAAEQCDTVTHEMDNSPHSDEVINLQPLHCLTFSNTHLVTLLLQSGLSSALQAPHPRCSFSSSLLSRLYFGLALPSPFFPPLSPLPLIFQEKNLEWFPRMRAMSLVSSEGDSEQNEMRCLQEKLENTVTLVAQLSGQLAELKEQVQYFSGRGVLAKGLQ